jgi:hypothetical protein
VNSVKARLGPMIFKKLSDVLNESGAVTVPKGTPRGPILMCRKAPLEVLFFDFLAKSCVATACSPLVPKGQVPCGAISVF